MSFDLESWLTGFCLALAGKSLPQGGGTPEPVAYSFNGIRLPIPLEVDPNQYPYRVIYRYDGLSEAQNPIYRMVCAGAPVELEYRVSLATYQKHDTLTWCGPYTAQWKTADNDNWEWDGEGDDADDLGSFALTGENKAIIWTNVDIKYPEDYEGDAALAGTIFMAGSEPVPIYE